MDEIKLHVKERARQLSHDINNIIIEKAELAAQEYCDSMGFIEDDDDEKYIQNVKDQYIQAFTEQIRDSIN